MKIGIRLHVASVYIGAPFEEEFNGFRCMFAGPMEGLTPVAVNFVGFDISSRIQQEFDNLYITIVRWPMERGIPNPAALVHGKGVRFNMFADDVRPVLAGG